MNKIEIIKGKGLLLPISPAFTNKEYLKELILKASSYFTEIYYGIDNITEIESDTLYVTKVLSENHYYKVELIQKNENIKIHDFSDIQIIGTSQYDSYLIITGKEYGGGRCGDSSIYNAVRNIINEITYDKYCSDNDRELYNNFKINVQELFLIKIYK